MNKIYINTDGGSRGNPGPAAIGVVFYDQSENVLYKIGKPIGETTNNVAEYSAIIEGLKILLKSRFLSENGSNAEVICRLDSQLVVEQICGRYKVKNEGLRPFYQELLSLVSKIKAKIQFSYVSREENTVADKLVNKALDQGENVT